MQRLRSLHHKQRYTQIANDAIDRLPSLEAVGLLATILRHSDDFDFQMSVLIKSKPDLGKQKAYRARAALIEYGYLVQVRFKHTYRGRLVTDIYRSPEPHSADDLAHLRERYGPGSETTIIDDDGRERQVTIVWSEITAAAGIETLTTSPPAEEPAKPQVAPDSGFPDSGQPDSGQPDSGQPDSGQPEPNKEDCSREDEKEHQQQQGSADADDDVGGEALADNTEDNATRTDEGTPNSAGGVEAQARQLIATLRPTLNPADRVQPHAGVVQPVARALRAEVPEQVIREYLVEGAESARRPAAIVVTKARNVDDLIQAREDAAQRREEESERDETGGTEGPEVPSWCGSCDEHDRMTFNTENRLMRCPQCNPRSKAFRASSLAGQAQDAANNLGMPQ